MNLWVFYLLPGLDMSTTNRVLSFLARQKPGISGRHLYPFAECVGFFCSFPILAHAEGIVAKQKYVQRWMTSEGIVEKCIKVDDFRDFRSTSLRNSFVRDLSNATIGAIIYFSIFLFPNHLYVFWVASFWVDSFLNHVCTVKMYVDNIRKMERRDKRRQHKTRYDKRRQDKTRQEDKARQE